MRSTPRKKAPANKRRLTDAFLRNLKPRSKTYLVWDDLQSGFGVAVTPAGTKTFKCTYYYGTRLRWVTLDRYPSIGLKDARKHAQTIRYKAVIAKTEGKKDPIAKKSDSLGKTLKDVAELYVERSAKLKNKSWRQGENLMQKYVLPTLGSRLVEDITQRDIQQVFNKLTIDKDKPVLANQSLAAVSAVLRWAVQQHIIEQNVARGIERNKVHAEERFLDDEEVKLVWPELVPSLRLVLLTAQRPGEVAHMRWQDLDLNKAVWSLPGEPDGDGDWPGTKNAKSHACPLTDLAMTILHELGPMEEGLVFDGKIPTTSGLLKKLKLPRFRPHHLRATAASGMDALGIPSDHISRVLNHAQSGVTQSYIRHDYHQQKLRALTAWSTHLEALIEGREVPSSVVDIRTAR